MVEHRVCGVDFLDLPCLVSRINLNLASNYMLDLRYQGISVDYENDPYPYNIKNEVPQPVNSFNSKSEGIIFRNKSNNLHHTYAAFKNYYREEVMKMKKMELTLILFPIDYLRELIIPEKYKFLKHLMELG